ncbi:protein YIPF1 isoform X1 [Microplitis mediator]|uniref:protein YIPF1 isoform X1 n=1 Tax=Microplitis mediator TaxID=375433 RepID=UPI00255636AF|nr:protein YIPF1 isoform X1 [Microplitis mediator]
MSNQFNKLDNANLISIDDYTGIDEFNDRERSDRNLESSAQQQTNISYTEPVVKNYSEDSDDPTNKKHAEENKNFWTLEYYQQFFNVETHDVFERIKKSMLPSNEDNYLLSQIKPNPDLYGPFWIPVTLIFVVAISGNFANYLQTANNGKYHWKYDFHIVSYAAISICLYVWMLPLSLWGGMKWTNASPNNSLNTQLMETNQDLRLLDLLCLYGYSLSIYIPVAILWTIQIGWFQWLLVGVASLMSGGVLLRCLLPFINSKQKLIYTAIITGMHLLLAAGFMLYFFHVPDRDLTSESNHGSTTIKTITLEKNN